MVYNYIITYFILSKIIAESRVLNTTDMAKKTQYRNITILTLSEHFNMECIYCIQMILAPAVVTTWRYTHSLWYRGSQGPLDSDMSRVSDGSTGRSPVALPTLCNSAGICSDLQRKSGLVVYLYLCHERRRHGMETLSALLAFYEENPPVTGGYSYIRVQSNRNFITYFFQPETGNIW